MTKKNRNTRRARGGKVSAVNAPTMNGMQQVNTWNLLDIIPITQDPTSGDSAQPANIQFAAGPNGWSWDYRQNGTTLSAEDSKYGGVTD
jgi:hypothetical protein